MKFIYALFFLVVIVSCKNSSNDDGTHSSAPAPTASEKSGRAALPDRIRCLKENSPYELILVLRNPQLPQDVTAIGLMKNQKVVLKIATQLFEDENNRLTFNEIPATTQSRQAKLSLESKEAILSNFHIDDLPENSVFGCQF